MKTYSFVALLALSLLPVIALGSGYDSCQASCEKTLAKGKENEDQKLHIQKGNLACKKFTGSNSKKAKACRNAFHRVGQKACHLSCASGLNAIATQNSHEVSQIRRNCAQQKAEKNACITGIAAGATHFSRVGHGLRNLLEHENVKEVVEEVKEKAPEPVSRTLEAEVPAPKKETKPEETKPEEVRELSVSVDEPVKEKEQEQAEPAAPHSLRDDANHMIDDAVKNIYDYSSKFLQAKSFRSSRSLKSVQEV